MDPAACLPACLLTASYLVSLGDVRCDINELQHPVNMTEYAFASKGYELYGN